MADIEPFFDAVDNTRYHYFDKKLDIKKDAVSIPSMSERYVLNKAMKKNMNTNLMKWESHASTSPMKDVTKKAVRIVKKSFKNIKNSQKIRLKRSSKQVWYVDQLLYILGSTNVERNV